MQEGSQHLQSTWHSLHVEWAGKDGEVGGTAICNISAYKNILDRNQDLAHCHLGRLIVHG